LHLLRLTGDGAFERGFALPEADLSRLRDILSPLSGALVGFKPPTPTLMTSFVRSSRRFPALLTWAAILLAASVNSNAGTFAYGNVHESSHEMVRSYAWDGLQIHSV